MPSLEFSQKDLEKLSRRTFKTPRDLAEALSLAKTELDGLDGDTIKAALSDGNRPDLLSVEGIAREIRLKTGVETGVPTYAFKKSGKKAIIDRELKNIRPVGAFALARNVDVTEDLLKALVQFQEKICLTFGRKRREVSMGIYDADQVHKNVRYVAASPDTAFVPLEYSAPRTLSEILAEHPKGKEYAHLLANMPKYPLLVDEKENVLSMPPVINSAGSGKVLPGKRNLFLDVTGYDFDKVNTALAILAMILADRGAVVETVEVKGLGPKSVHTPVMATRKLAFELAHIEALTGLSLSHKQMASLLARSGYNASINGKKITVEYPSYRVDILHFVDVIEDVLIAYGYSNVQPAFIDLATIGGENARSKTSDQLVDTLIGLGLQQVLSYYLTNPARQQPFRTTSKPLVELANPQSALASVFRDQLTPALIEILSKNTHRAYPQGIFEVGSVVLIDEARAFGSREPLHVAIALAGAHADFNRAKGMGQAIAEAFGLEIHAQPSEYPFLTKGRQARIQLGAHAGYVGELHEERRTSANIHVPVCVLEIEWNENGV